MRLDAYLGQVKSLRAGFSQVLTDETGHQQRAEGRFWLQRPNRFRWSYERPSPQVIVADGERLWLYDVELEQVVVQPMSEGLDETPAMLLGGDADLDRHFSMQELGSRDGRVWLELTPRGRGGNYRRIRLAFSDTDLVEMTVLDNFGQTTRITFHDIVRNPHLEMDLFRFEPPEGVDVVGGARR